MTVEDIVEEVVGEIHDEFDEKTPMIVSTGNDNWLVDARIPINDLEDELPISFEEEREFDTLGGIFFLSVRRHSTGRYIHYTQRL